MRLCRTLDKTEAIVAGTFVVEEVDDVLYLHEFLRAWEEKDAIVVRWWMHPLLSDEQSDL